MTPYTQVDDETALQAILASWIVAYDGPGFFAVTLCREDGRGFTCRLGMRECKDLSDKLLTAAVRLQLERQTGKADG